ncbi:NlpC/P60 family protein [Antribacter sp. KLBMP9083]|uniref:NlpC/P60 family protein n=1 Tax=Antribacter soli TaxID=2910976 RepID=A0AA41U7K5_9MICO|nr:C40 family peptidase [Antribacter soli]MCF4122128.1 NlpC/P60 family protein [Antribacter soli]
MSWKRAPWRAVMILVLAVGFSLPWGNVTLAGARADSVTDDDVAAARADAAAGEMDVAEADAALDDLRTRLAAAQVRVQVAAEDHAQAEQALADATAATERARDEAVEARAGEVAARASLAEVYRTSTRAGDTSGLAVLLGAHDVSDVVGQDAASRAVQRRLGTSLAAYQDARSAAESADARWSAARDAQQEAADEAARTYDAARLAAAALQEETTAAEQRRAELVARLAELRATSVEVERQRETDRAAAELAAQEAAAREALERQAAAEPTTNSPTPGGPGAGPAPGGGSDGPGEPTAPAEPPASGGGASPAPTPSPTPTPAPKPPPPPSTGVSVGSVAQGEAAVAWARSKIGLDYQPGGNGPTAYDCSGLTSGAWASAGVSITRTSRSQYLAVGKVAYSALRPGDLIFYATDTADPSTIFHVAIYAGGGRMIEAVYPGTPVRETALRMSSAMAFAGRP